MSIVDNLLSNECVCSGIVAHVFNANTVDDAPSVGGIDLVAQTNAKGAVGDSQIERLVPVVTLCHIDRSSGCVRGNIFAVWQQHLAYAVVHLGILAVGGDVDKAASLTLACTFCIVVGIAQHVFLEFVVSLAVKSGSTAEALQTEFIDTVLEVGDVLIGVERLACLLRYAITYSELIACPEVAVVGEVGVLDDGKEACVVRIFLSADGAEAILEIVVGNDDLVVVGVCHARRVNRAVAEHLALRINLCVSVGEGQRLVVNLSVVVEVLEPCDSALVAVQLVAERAVHNLVVADERHLLLYLACAVVV